jgi:hypothetical protein
MLGFQKIPQSMFAQFTINVKGAFIILRAMGVKGLVVSKGMVGQMSICGIHSLG